MNYILGIILVLIAIAITNHLYLYKKYKPGTGRITHAAIRQKTETKKTAIHRGLSAIINVDDCKFARAKYIKTYTCDDKATILYDYYEIEYWLKKEQEEVSGIYDIYGSGGYPM
jgi:hypothetical protein